MVGQPGEGVFIFFHVEVVFPPKSVESAVFFGGHLGWDGVAIFWGFHEKSKIYSENIEPALIETEQKLA